MQQLTLVLPDLLWPHDHPLPPLNLPAFDVLRRWAVHTRIGQTDIYSRFLWSGSLCQQFDRHAAATTLLCSPVSQTVGMHQTAFVSGSQLALETPEAESFCQTLNAFFKQDGIVFTPATPFVWLMQTPEPWVFETVPLWQAHGIFGKDSKPVGRDAGRLLQILTECQMLLHSHPLNQTRTQRGAPPVNGVWLQNDCHGTADSDTTLFSDSIWSPHAFRLPENFDALQAQRADQPVVFLTQLSTAADAGDAFAFAETLHAWENDWFAPACRSLRNGRLKQLRICTQTHDGSGTEDIDVLNIRKRLPFFLRRRSAFNGQNL